MFVVQHYTLPPSDIPKFWGFLNSNDCCSYMYLRSNLASSQNKVGRNRRVENFTETLELIKKYCKRGDGDDWRRYLVTGICWLPEGGIAVNTHQLRLLVSKCKSSINGSLHKMGYTYSMVRQRAAESMMNVIPLLRDNPAELRQWTVRLDHPVENETSDENPIEYEPTEKIQSSSVHEAPPLFITETIDGMSIERDIPTIFNGLSFELELDSGFDASTFQEFW